MDTKLEFAKPALDELKNINFNELIHPDVTKQSIDETWEILKKGKIWTGNTKFITKYKEAFYLKNTGVNYFTNKVFELKEIKLIPTRIGKLLVFPLIQKITSFIFGQIIQTIDITLIVKK